MNIDVHYKWSLERYDGRSVEENSNANSNVNVKSLWWFGPEIGSKMQLHFALVV